MAILAARVVGPARAEVLQKDGVRVNIDGDLAPRSLPRSGIAPVSVAVEGRISPVGPGTKPPKLTSISIAINRHGRLAAKGLPVCPLQRIDPSTSSEAVAACRASLVGNGSFSANVRLPEQSPFPSVGKVLAFNGRLDGHRVLLAHIYGDRPLPTSYVLPFYVEAARGEFGTVLRASLPEVTGEWGFVTGISMKLGRSYRRHGSVRSYLSAGCPAPAGFDSVAFPLMRTDFVFSGGRKLTSTLNRNCSVRS